jgi:hypothetical protein
MLNCAKTNSFTMNDQDPFGDNDDSLFVFGNTPPPQTATPEFDIEMNYQNHPWDDDLDLLNGDNLYFPENTPIPQTPTPEFPFKMDYQKYLDDNYIDFLGDNLNVFWNTPDWNANLKLFEDNKLDVSEDTQGWDMTKMELLEDNNLHGSGNTPYWDNNLNISEDTQHWDTNLELLEYNNLNLSGNPPNSENDIEFLEGENLSISENTPPSQPPTEENVLCPILQSIVEGTYDTPVQPGSSIPGSETSQYDSPSSSIFGMTSPLIEDLPAPQNIPAERGGSVPVGFGPLAHEMDYINFIGTGSHRRRLRPGAVPRRKTAKIVAAADSEPYYNDGPRMEEFRETREMWMTRLKNARTVMSIRHKRMCSQLTRRPKETARKWTNRLCSRTAIMRRADIKHASKMNPSDPAFDSEYRRVFYEAKEKRHRHNAAERANVLLIRRNYDFEHGRPRVSTPTPPEDSDDEKFYDHELDYPCYKPSRKDTALTMVSPMVIYEDSGVDGSDTSPEASSAANSDVRNGDLYQDTSLQQDTWLQQAQTHSGDGHGDSAHDTPFQQGTWSHQTQAKSDSRNRDLSRNPFFRRASVKPDQESCNPTKKKYQRKCVPRDSRGLRLNACATRKLRPDARLQLEKDKCAQCLIRRRKCDQAKPTCGSCVKNRHICRPQGSENRKLKTPQRCKKVKTVPPNLAANSEAGNGDLDQDASLQQAQPAQANSDAGCGDQDTSFQQVQTADPNSDAGYEDLIQDLSSGQAQENLETGYGDLYPDTLLLQAQVNSDVADEDLFQDTWFQQVPAEPDAGYEDLFQDTWFQQLPAEPEAVYEDLYQDTSFQQSQADSDAECGDFSQDTSFRQTQANSDIGYKVWQGTCLQQTQAKPDDEGSSNPPKHKRRRVRKHQGDIESTSKRDTTPHACAECKRRKIRCDGRHWNCLGCQQIIAQPKEDKCTHCFTDGRICDQVKPGCGNCVKRKLRCRPHESAVPSSRFFYSEVYSGFPEGVLGAQD